MLSLIYVLACSILHTRAYLQPRGDPGFQYVPPKATTPDNKYNIGTVKLTGQPDDTKDTVPAVYGPRSVSTSIAMSAPGLD